MSPLEKISPQFTIDNPLGVMLVGDLGRLQKALSDLPPCSVKSSFTLNSQMSNSDITEEHGIPQDCNTHSFLISHLTPRFQSEEIQQPCTKDLELQNKLKFQTEDGEKDSLSTKNIPLDETSNTKRSILKTIVFHSSIYNVNMPVLDHFRLFTHSLQCNKKLSWDEVISLERENGATFVGKQTQYP